MIDEIKISWYGGRKNIWLKKERNFYHIIYNYSGGIGFENYRERIANVNFMEETEDRNGNYMLGGHWMSDLSYQFANKCKFDLVQVDGYSSYAYSDEQMAVFTYTGGDIYLTLFTDKVKYEAEKERTIKFYEEENWYGIILGIIDYSRYGK